ncbi:hypothetical protein BD289DRAFT_432517 [Coniella lustricola]|uniref:SnoaL-like domain-containing protein n=1 Tax=Coniella lustricola TaxID=2025994 RepID=A0A2T3A9S4_9PEZI|nr:hypothetical protein BD289DRAFT_432517 [Coniella lustricola]
MTATDLDTAAHVAALKTLIQRFFDAINAADPKRLQRLFYPGARVGILRQEPARAPLRAQDDDLKQEKKEEEVEEKLVVVIRTDIETFVKLLEDGEKKRREEGDDGGGGKGNGPDVIKEVPDLKLAEVRIDGLFATAWCPFRVYFDGVLHHYGTFVYTFGHLLERDLGGEGKNEGENDWAWRIEGLTQSYRRTVGWEGARGNERRF